MLRFFSLINFKEQFLLKIYTKEFDNKKDLETKIKEVCITHCFKSQFEYQKTI